jgi:esterase/lipase superfamily enzyme
MAVRFTPHFVGTQFHPEADPLSFIANLKKAETREKIIILKGRKKFRNILEDLVDEDKIYKTNETIIPNFIRIAINDILKTKKILFN